MNLLYCPVDREPLVYAWVGNKLQATCAEGHLWVIHEIEPGELDNLDYFGRIDPATGGNCFQWEGLEEKRMEEAIAAELPKHELAARGLLMAAKEIRRIAATLVPRLTQGVQ